MRDYGKVYTRFWLKQNVLSWSDSAKLLGLYLLTCPHCNLLGCFRLPIGYVASDLNWEEQQVAKALNELEQDQFLIRCEESGWTLIRSFLKHNPIENPNQGKAAFRLLKDVPADFVGMASLLKSLAAFQARLPEEFSSLFMPDGNPVRDSQRSDDSERSNKPTVKTVNQIQFEDFWDVQIRKEKKAKAKEEYLAQKISTKLLHLEASQISLLQNNGIKTIADFMAQTENSFASMKVKKGIPFTARFLKEQETIRCKLENL